MQNPLRTDTYLGRTIKTEELPVKTNILFNTIGSLTYQGCLWLMTVLVVALSGNYSNAGTLAYAMALGNIFFTIAIYAMRTYQVSDVEGRYSQSNYLAFRIITILLALVLCSIYALATGIPKDVIVPTLLFLLFKADEELAAVCYGSEQRFNRMDYAGISQFWRGIAALLFFGLILRATASLSLAILGMFMSCLAVTLLYDIPHMSAFGSIKPAINKSITVSLLRQCFPAVLATLLLTSVVSITRQYFGTLYGTEDLGKYASVATPAVIIQAMASFLYSPLIEPLSRTLSVEGKGAFAKHLVKVSLGLFAFLGILMLILGAFGNWFLTLIYGPSIAPFTYLLTLVLVITMQAAFMMFLSDVLIILRSFKTVLVANLSSFLVTLAAMQVVIPRYGMDGINYVLIASYSAGLLVALIGIIRETRSH